MTSTPDAIKATVGGETIGRYFDVFRESRPTFVIFWPDGKPILCQKARAFGDRDVALSEADVWRKQIESPALDTEWPDMALTIARVEAAKGSPIGVAELAAAFMLKKFVVDVAPIVDGKDVRARPEGEREAFDDVSAVAFIEVGVLLRFLFDQIVEGIDAVEVSDQLSEVEAEKKDLANRPDGNLSEQSSQTNTVSTGGTRRRKRKAG